MPQRLSDAEILELGDLNLAESAREMLRWHTGYFMQEADDLLLVHLLARAHVVHQQRLVGVAAIQRDQGLSELLVNDLGVVLDLQLLHDRVAAAG